MLIPYLLWRPTSTACPELVSGIPGMSIKKSPKVLPEKCAQKQRDHSPSGGKTDKTVQDMKISPIPTTDGPWKTPKNQKNLLDCLYFGK